MFMAASVDILNKIAEGDIKTPWGEMMKSDNPMEAGDKVYARLKKEYGHTIAFAFLLVAPLVAETVAIENFKADYYFEEPEILDIYEALLIASLEMGELSRDEMRQLAMLLKYDVTMQRLNDEGPSVFYLQTTEESIEAAIERTIEYMNERRNRR